MRPPPLPAFAPTEPQGGLNMYIREIRNPLHFQELCQALLTAEYEDFETVRDYNGDIR